jgi:rRNA maturation endonuclease Nob1
LLLLDAAGILEAPNITPSECVTVPEVTGEISPGGSAYRRLEQLLAAGLRVQASSNASLARVKRTAQEAGNWGRLSPADASILALALDLPRGKLVTDDYTVLDLAKRLGISTQTIRTKGIDVTKDWIARCAGCGRAYEESIAGRPCPVCGAEVRLKPRPR